MVHFEFWLWIPFRCAGRGPDERQGGPMISYKDFSEMLNKKALRPLWPNRLPGWLKFSLCLYFFPLLLLDSKGDL